MPTIRVPGTSVRAVFSERDWSRGINQDWGFEMDDGKQAKLASTDFTVDSLDEWLTRVEAMGELKRITAPVDPVLEMATITYLSGKTQGGPTLLFENILGHPASRLLFNPFGSSLNRAALTIRELPGKTPIELTRILSDKMKRRIPPKEIDAAVAPVNANIKRGDEVDLTKFPAPQMWPLDGGKYIGTSDAVITRDPSND